MSKYDTFLGTDAAKFEEMTAVDGQRHTRASMETGCGGKHGFGYICL